MGDPVEPAFQPCAWNNPGFPDGKTPKFVKASVSGVICTSEWFSDTPNGTFLLEQESAYVWSVGIDLWMVTFSWSPTMSSFVILTNGGSMVFRNYCSGRMFSNERTSPSYTWYDGDAYCSWYSGDSPLGSPAYIANHLRLPDKKNTFVEIMATGNGGKMRFANRFNGTCIYIKERQ